MRARLHAIECFQEFLTLGGYAALGKKSTEVLDFLAQGLVPLVHRVDGALERRDEIVAVERQVTNQERGRPDEAARHVRDSVRFLGRQLRELASRFKHPPVDQVS